MNHAFDFTCPSCHRDDDSCSCQDRLKRTVEVSGENWIRRMTPDEYTEWVAYDKAHPYLANKLPCWSIMDMFLNNYRRCPTFYNSP